MAQVNFSSWGRQVIDNRQGGDAEVEVAKKIEAKLTLGDMGLVEDKKSTASKFDPK